MPQREIASSHHLTPSPSCGSRCPVSHLQLQSGAASVASLRAEALQKRVHRLVRVCRALDKDRTRQKAAVASADARAAKYARERDDAIKAGEVRPCPPLRAPHASAHDAGMLTL